MSISDLVEGVLLGAVVGVVLLAVATIIMIMMGDRI